MCVTKVSNQRRYMLTCAVVAHGAYNMSNASVTTLFSKSSVRILLRQSANILHLSMTKQLSHWTIRFFQPLLKVFLHKYESNVFILTRSCCCFSLHPLAGRALSPLRAPVITPSHDPELFPFTSIRHVLLSPHSSAETTRGREREIKRD